MLTVVVVFHSDLDLLQHTLESIHGVCDAAIVVDVSGGGNAGTVAARYGATLLSAPENRGYGWACNLGISRAGDGLVLVSNADVIYREGAIPAMKAVALRNGGIVAPMQFLGPGESMDGAGESLQLGISFRASLQRWTGLGRKRTASIKRSVLNRLSVQDAVPVPNSLTLSGASLMALKSTWAALEGFDERFFLYQEDADLTMRARSLGLGVWLTSAGKVTHRVGSNARGLSYSAISAAITSERMAWGKYGLNLRLLKAIQGIGVLFRGLKSVLESDLTSARIWMRLFLLVLNPRESR